MRKFNPFARQTSFDLDVQGTEESLKNLFFMLAEEESGNRSIPGSGRGSMLSRLWDPNEALISWKKQSAAKG